MSAASWKRIWNNCVRVLRASSRPATLSEQWKNQNSQTVENYYKIFTGTTTKFDCNSSRSWDKGWCCHPKTIPAWIKTHKVSTWTDSSTADLQHLNLRVLVLGFKYRSLSSVKSPPRQPAVESISPSRTAQANDGNPSGWLKISPSEPHTHGLSSLVDFTWTVICSCK